MSGDVTGDTVLPVASERAESAPTAAPQDGPVPASCAWKCCRFGRPLACSMWAEVQTGMSSCMLTAQAAEVATASDVHVIDAPTSLLCHTGAAPVTERSAPQGGEAHKP